MEKRDRLRFRRAASALAVLAVCTAAGGWLLLSTFGGKTPKTQNAPAQSTASSAGGGSSASSAAGDGASRKVMDRSLVLVNPAEKLPDWYRPNLVTFSGIEMDASVEAPYVAMRDAAARDGISLWISSAYRSVERQGELFEQEVELYRKTYPTRAVAETFAERSVARPGCSEHATGLALDLNGVRDDFDQTPAFRWLNAHAQEYGFILRYPKDKQEITRIKYEPWHYRYVGATNAVAMKISGQCLEEYLQSGQKTTAAN